MMFVWDNMGDEINAKMQIEFFLTLRQFKKRNTACSFFFNLIPFSQLLLAEVEAKVCFYAVMRQVCQLLPCLEIIFEFQHP